MKKYFKYVTLTKPKLNVIKRKFVGLGKLQDFVESEVAKM